VVLVALALSELEAVHEVEVIRDDLGEAPSEAANSFYNKVPGFSLTAGGSTHEVSSEQECQAKCSPDTSCKSFSWREEDKQCITSTESLSYDPEFELYVRAKNSDSGQKFRFFQGMVYRADGWDPILGKSLQECETACDATCQGTECKCHTFSYTMPDDDLDKAQCLLSGKAISYSPGFTYFEKKSSAVVVTPAKDTVAPPVQSAVDPQAGALEVVEKQKIAKAKREIADATRLVDDARSGLAASKKEWKAKVEAADDKEANLVSETRSAQETRVREKVAAFVAAETKEWRNKQENTQLEFAAAEVKGKKDEKDRLSADELKEKQSTAAAEKEIRAKKTQLLLDDSKKETEFAQRTTAVQDGRMKLEDEQKALQDAKAHMMSEKSAMQDAVQAAKEHASKKEASAAEEASQKKVAGKESVQKGEAAAADKIAAVRAQALKQEGELQASAEEEANNRVAEVGVKNMANQKLRQEAAAATMKAALKRAAEDEQALDGARNRVQEAEATALKAQAAAAQTAALAVVNRTAIQVKANQSLAEYKILADEKAQEARARDEERMLEVKEESEKKEQTAKAAGRKAEEAASQDAREAVNKRNLAKNEKAAKFEANAKETSEKNAAELESKKAAERETAEKAEAKIAEEVKQSQTKLEAQEASNKAAAQKIRDDATADAKKVTKESHEKAKAELDIAAQKAARAVGKIKKEAAKAAALSLSSLAAGEAAFVDSGFVVVGENLADLKKQLDREQGVYDTAVAAAKAAKDALTQANNELNSAKDAAGKAEAAHSAAAALVAGGGAASRKLLQEAAAVQGAVELAQKQEETALQGKRAAWASKLQGEVTAAKGVQTVKEAAHKQHEAAHVKKQDDAAVAKAQRDLARKKHEVAAANAAPATTTFGDVNTQLQFKGVLRVQSSPRRNQITYIKFPVATLPSTQTIVAAHLRLYKTAGGESPIVVKTSKCTWKRPDITYDNSRQLVVESESPITQGHAIFPATNNVWVDVKLDGNTIEQARQSGSICLQVHGGSEHEAVVLSSELTSNPPTLGIQTSSNAELLSSVVLLDEADQY
jgi:hypothetical protein